MAQILTRNYGSSTHARATQTFLRQAIQSGRIRREGDAFHEALALKPWLYGRNAEILTAVDFAYASLARGEGVDLTPESTLALSVEAVRDSRVSRISLFNGP